MESNLKVKTVYILTDKPVSVKGIFLWAVNTGRDMLDNVWLIEQDGRFDIMNKKDVFKTESMANRYMKKQKEESINYYKRVIENNQAILDKLTAQLKTEK